MSSYNELKRRNVFRVAIAYLAGACRIDTQERAFDKIDIFCFSGEPNVRFQKILHHQIMPGS
jgi:hypothetical protein